MKVKLEDGAPRTKASVEINISKNGNTLEIGPVTGVGEPPVVLEFYRGNLTVRTYNAKAEVTHEQEIPYVTAVEPTAFQAPNAPALAANGSMTTALADSTTTDDELAAFDAA